jgi:hypothetical protein
MEYGTTRSERPEPWYSYVFTLLTDAQSSWARRQICTITKEFRQINREAPASGVGVRPVKNDS